MTRLANKATWAVLALVTMAGCLSNDLATEPEIPDVPPTDGSKAVRVSDELTGCVEVAAVFPVETARAQAILPTGFRAQDAATTFSDAVIHRASPAGTGQTIVGLTVFRCDQSATGGGPVAWASFGVFIERPLVPGLALDPAEGDVYDVRRVVEGERLASLLESVNYTMTRGSAGAGYEDLVPAGESMGGTGSAATADAGGTLFDFTVEVQGPGVAGAPRWWRQTADGLAVFIQTKTSIWEHDGELTRCSMRAGTPEASLVGADCSTNGRLALVERFDLASEFHFRPGLSLGD